MQKPGGLLNSKRKSTAKLPGGMTVGGTEDGIQMETRTVYDGVKVSKKNPVIVVDPGDHSVELSQPIAQLTRQRAFAEQGCEKSRFKTHRFLNNPTGPHQIAIRRSGHKGDTSIGHVAANGLQSWQRQQKVTQSPSADDKNLAGKRDVHRLLF